VAQEVAPALTRPSGVDRLEVLAARRVQQLDLLPRLAAGYLAADLQLLAVGKPLVGANRDRGVLTGGGLGGYECNCHQHGDDRAV
jgi:hypothetical protein